MTSQEQIELIAKLQAENEALRASKGGSVTLVKHSDKGCVSAYGLGRYPTSLYPEQWVALAAAMPKILAYIKANEQTLGKLGAASKAAKAAEKSVASGSQANRASGF